MITMDIEAMLTWAWTIELPKANAATTPIEIGTAAPSTWALERRRIAMGGGTGTGGMASMIADIDDLDFRNRYGVTVDEGARIGPHPDAIALHAAVHALDHTDFVFPAGWSPYEDMGPEVVSPEGVEALRKGLDRVTVRIGDERVARPRLARQLIERHAILGTAPAWRADAPVRKFVLGPRGQHPAWFRKVKLKDKGGMEYEAEVDGFDRKSRRPYPDAYRKTFLDPEPTPIVVLRAEYALWRAAIEVLTIDMAPILTERRLLLCPRQMEPWAPCESARS